MPDAKKNDYQRACYGNDGYGCVLRVDSFLDEVDEPYSTSKAHDNSSLYAKYMCGSYADSWAMAKPCSTESTDCNDRSGEYWVGCEVTEFGAAPTTTGERVNGAPQVNGSAYRHFFRYGNKQEKHDEACGKPKHGYCEDHNLLALISHFMRPIHRPNAPVQPRPQGGAEASQ